MTRSIRSVFSRTGRTGGGRRRGSLGRALLAGAAAGATVVAGFAAAAPADAASPKYPRVMPVSSSDGYLVYRQKTATVAGLYLTEKSAL